MNRNRSVLVTGAAGFIGSHVAEAYRDAGWEVTGVDDLSSGRRQNIPEGIAFHELDLRSERLEQLFAESEGFDIVNHHAAQIDVRVSVARPRHDASVNLGGLLNLLECAREADTERVVFASSGGVLYGEADQLPTIESAEKKPTSPYGVSKLASEHYLNVYRQVHGLESVSLRYANVYGPRQDPAGEAGVVAIFSRQIRRGERLAIYGDGEQTRDFVFVKDVADANVLASLLELPETDGIDDVAFNVGTGHETSVNELAETMMDVAGRSVPLEYEPPRDGELRRSVLATSKFRDRGWEARCGLEEGLAETMDVAQTAGT